MDPASDETILQHQVRRPTSDVQLPECLRLYKGLKQHSRWKSVALTKHETTCGKELVQLLRHTDAHLTLAPCYSDGCNLRKTATDMGQHETTLTLPPAVQRMEKWESRSTDLQENPAAHRARLSLSLHSLFPELWLQLPSVLHYRQTMEKQKGPTFQSLAIPFIVSVANAGGI